MKQFRAAAYLATASVPGLVGLTVLAVLVVAGGLLSAVVVGIPVLASAGLVGIPVAAAERWRLQLVDPVPVADPHRPPAPGVWGWLRTRYTEPATWREFGFALLFLTVLWPVDLLVVLVAVGLPLTLITSVETVLVGHATRRLWPGLAIHTPVQAVLACVSGLLLLACAVPAVSVFARARGRLTRLLLAPRSDELAELNRSRARLVGAFDAERRRIERDLHDGAQQRLVALSMSLGLALLDLPPGPARDQVAAARDQAGQALGELRELIHGIHPHVLTDRGLAAAVAELADRSPLPVTVALTGPRPAAALESTGYFAVCEALANMARHSRATRASISGGRDGDLLLLEISDDGVGGADPAAGSGLTGLADRVAAVGGVFSVVSPAGGPTTLTLRLPWEGAE